MDNYINNGQDGFADKIKTTINYFADPARRWQKLRNKMLNTEVSIHEVAMLESYFVKSIVKNDKNIFDKMQSKYNNKNRSDIDFKDLLLTSKSIIETTITLINVVNLILGDINRGVVKRTGTPKTVRFFIRNIIILQIIGHILQLVTQGLKLVIIIG